jgi:hypothetical protein
LRARPVWHVILRGDARRRAGDRTCAPVRALRRAPRGRGRGYRPRTGAGYRPAARGERGLARSIPPVERAIPSVARSISPVVRAISLVVRSIPSVARTISPVARSCAAPARFVATRAGTVRTSAGTGSRRALSIPPLAGSVPLQAGRGAAPAGRVAHLGPCFFPATLKVRAAARSNRSIHADADAVSARDYRPNPTVRGATLEVRAAWECRRASRDFTGARPHSREPRGAAPVF